VIFRRRVASKVLALPHTRTGVRMLSPISGDSTRTSGDSSSKSARPTGRLRTMPSPPNDVTGFPSSSNRTLWTAGKRVAVNTTCARRARIDRLPPPPSSYRADRSAVATWRSTTTELSFVPDGMAVVRPWARS